MDIYGSHFESYAPEPKTGIGAGNQDQLTVPVNSGPITASLTYVPAVLRIDNPSGYWLYFPDINRWVMPKVMGVVLTWFGGTNAMRVTVRSDQVPQGMPPVDTTAQQSASVMFSDIPAPESAGAQIPLATAPWDRPTLAVWNFLTTVTSTTLIAAPASPQRIWVHSIWLDVDSSVATANANCSIEGSVLGPLLMLSTRATGNHAGQDCKGIPLGVGESVLLRLNVTATIIRGGVTYAIG